MITAKPQQSLKQQQGLQLSLFQKQSLAVLNFSAYDLDKWLIEKSMENPLIQYRRRYEKKIFSFIENLDDFANQPEQSLEKKILDNLIFQKHEEATLHCAKIILDGLNEDFYFQDDPTKFCKIQNLGIRKFQKTLKILKSMEPYGMGATDLRDRILCISAHHPKIPIEFQRFIKNQWEQFQKKNVPKSLSKKYSREKIDFFYQKIEGGLRDFMTKKFRPEYIIPDAIVFLDENSKKFDVNFTNPFSEDITIQKLPSKEKLREPLSIKLAEAKSLLKALQRRENTLSQVMTYLLEHQQDFFTGSYKTLSPISISKMATELKIHQTTIYRTLQNKTFTFDSKNYRLSDLLPKITTFGGQKGHSKSPQSHENRVDQSFVLEKLKGIIQREDKQKPYSDQDIARIFQDQENLKLSRRVIAKYRVRLKIPTSAKRRN